MGLGALVERVLDADWLRGPGRMCSECGYSNPADEEWGTQVHAGGFGIAVIDVCPECDTPVKTRWSPS